MTQPPGSDPDVPPAYPSGHFGPPPGYFGPPPGYSHGPPPGYAPPPGYGYGYGYPPYGPPPAPRPGCVPLRPLGVGDILDGAFKVVRRNPKVMLGLSAGFALFETVLSVALSYVSFHTLSGIDQNGSTTDISPLLGNDALQLIGLFVTALVGAVLTGMLTLVVTQDVLGRRMSAGEVWQQIAPRMWTLVGLALVTGILEFLGLIPCLVIGIWLWGIWAVAVPACIVERLGIRAALGRSRRLVEGTFWRVWGIRALGALVVMFTSSLISLPFSIFGVVDLLNGVSNHEVPFGALLLIGVGSLLGRTLTAPVQAAIDALLYVDLRMRREGLDITLQQAAAAPAGPLTAG